MLNEEQRKVLGQRLSELREKAGVPASVVARDALGYQNGSHVAVTRLERAIQAFVRQDHLLLLSRYYAVAPSYLFVAAETLQQSQGDDRAQSRPLPCAAEDKGEAEEPSSLEDDLLQDPACLVDFASRVRWARLQAGLSLEDFAFAVRGRGALITQGDVRAWESGERQANPIQLRALSLFSRYGERWFLDGGPLQKESGTAVSSAWTVGKSPLATGWQR